MFQKVRKVEFAFYIVGFVVLLFALLMIILGIIADNWIVQGYPGGNAILVEQSKWLEWVGIQFLTYRNLGFIILAISAAIFVINLVVHANYFAKIKEKEERRKLRKQKMESALVDDNAQTALE